ncbi:MAG: hypothetical protein ACT4OS_05895 [Acidimicrobiales bacterium]
MRQPPEPRPHPKRLEPGNARCQAVLEALDAVQRQVAEQILRGGLDAVRAAMAEQNTQAKAKGEPEIQAGPLMAMAEDLLPALRAAQWHDRADAAAAMVDEVSLRDLRSVVRDPAAQEAGRDEACRELATLLKEAFSRRQVSDRDAWTAEIVGNLDAGRVLRALRVSSTPPEPEMRMSEEVITRLAAAVGAAMDARASPDRWQAMLRAVVTSPVRTRVAPTALPDNAAADLVASVARLRGRIPGLVALVGPALVAPRIGSRPGRPLPPPPPPRRSTVNSGNAVSEPQSPLAQVPEAQVPEAQVPEAAAGEGAPPAGSHEPGEQVLAGQEIDQTVC